MTIWSTHLVLAAYVAQIVRRFVRSHHVAVANEGVTHVREWRAQWFCEEPRDDDCLLTVQSVPFDHIADCRIAEPSTFLWIRNLLGWSSLTLTPRWMTACPGRPPRPVMCA